MLINITQNLLKVLVEFNHPDSKTSDSGVFNFRIKDRYKKFFKSEVLIRYKEQNLICKFEYEKNAHKTYIYGITLHVFEK